MKVLCTVGIDESIMYRYCTIVLIKVLCTVGIDESIMYSRY